MSAAISPEGKYLAYVDQTGLYLRLIDSGQTHPVALSAELTGRIFLVRWFPEGGKLLATLAGTEGVELWAITVLGEAAPQLLCRNGARPAVSADGRLLAFVNGKWTNFGNELLVGGINGEMPRRLAVADGDQSFWNPAWSPDGRWVAYLRTGKSQQGASSTAVEVRPAAGGPPNTVVTESNLPKGSAIGVWEGLTWSPDWRLLFSVGVPQPPGAPAKSGLWAVRVEPQGGQAAGQPERLAQWTDIGAGDVTVTADGKRLAFVKSATWQDVYVGELGPDGAGMKTPRRFTLDNRGSSPQSWTRDSQAILFDSSRNGRLQIFRQGLHANIAEAIVQGTENYGGERVSPDGAWVLYKEQARTEPGAPSSPYRLMRRPVGGGSPEMVLEAPAAAGLSYCCPVRPGSPCVLGQQEGKDLVFYLLDPVRGKGSQVGKIETRGPESTFWNISPDGARLAGVDGRKYEGKIKVLTLSDHAWHEVSVEPEWSDLQSIAWAMDGKGFFATVWRPGSFNLVYITSAGKVKPLLRGGHRQYLINPLPSPDGRYLAFQAQTWDSNVWMLENF